jgi:hypothetical protein
MGFHLFFNKFSGLTSAHLKTPVEFIVPNLGYGTRYLVTLTVVDFVNFIGLLLFLLTFISRMPVTQAMIMKGYDNNVYFSPLNQRFQELNNRNSLKIHFHSEL